MAGRPIGLQRLSMPTVLTDYHFLLHVPGEQRSLVDLLDHVGAVGLDLDLLLHVVREDGGEAGARALPEGSDGSHLWIAVGRDEKGR